MSDVKVAFSGPPEEPNYRLEYTNEDSRVAFRVWEITGWGDGYYVYSDNSYEPTENGLFLSVDIKWDGCANNWDFKVCPHTHSLDDVERLAVMMKDIYIIAWGELASHASTKACYPEGWK